MNSDLQEEMLKLKNKLHSEQTFDIDKDFRISFAPKLKDQFLPTN